MAKGKIVKELLGIGVGVSGKTAKKAKRKAAQDDKMSRAGKRYRSRSVEPKGSTASTTTTSKTNTRKENEFQKLSREYDGLKMSAKRAEVAKGSDSKYYKVIQARKPEKQKVNLSEVEIDTSGFGDVSKAGRLYKGGLTKNAKPKPKPTHAGGATRGKAGSLGNFTSGKQTKEYKAGTGKGTVAKPRGVGCAMRGYGKAM